MMVVDVRGFGCGRRFIKEALMLSMTELSMRFGPIHEDGPEQVLMEQVDERLISLASLLNDSIEDCRELSIALTKLEEARHWAAAATRHMPNDFLSTLTSSAGTYEHDA